jgi:hypothetical protein
MTIEETFGQLVRLSNAWRERFDVRFEGGRNAGPMAGGECAHRNPGDPLGPIRTDAEKPPEYLQGKVRDRVWFAARAQRQRWHCVPYYQDLAWTQQVLHL